MEISRVVWHKQVVILICFFELLVKTQTIHCDILLKQYVAIFESESNVSETQQTLEQQMNVVGDLQQGENAAQIMKVCNIAR